MQDIPTLIEFCNVACTDSIMEAIYAGSIDTESVLVTVSSISRTPSPGIIFLEFCGEDVRSDTIKLAFNEEVILSMLELKSFIDPDRVAVSDMN
jgi:hypothetical protein